MRTIAWALLIGAAVAAAWKTPLQETIRVSSAEELRAALRVPLEDVEIRLSPGSYWLAGDTIDYTQHGCGADVMSVYSSTAGLTVTGKRVRLLGVEGETILTGAVSHNLVFKDCNDCAIEGIVIRSNRPHEAFDGALGSSILIQRSTVHITNCVIDRSASQASGYGIRMKEQAQATIDFNEIHECTVGIGLYEDAKANISNNLIDAGSAKKRFQGLLVGCNAAAVAERNRILGSNFGVTLLDAATLDFTHNIVENIAQDGLSATSSRLGRIVIEENVFFDCGSSGIAIQAEGDQIASNNLIVETGQMKPRRSAVYVFGSRADAAVRKNTLYGNTVTDAALDRDVPREAFWRARRSWTRTYRNNSVGVDGRHKFYESAFLTRYGRWAK